MNLFKNIKSLADVMHTMQQLEDPEFLTEQGLTQEDVVSVKKELEDQMEPFKTEVQSYIEYKLTERQEHQILANGIANQIKGLSERMNKEGNKIGKIDSWIDYLCKFAGITGLKTPVAEIKYTGGDKMKITAEAIADLPEYLKEYDLFGALKIDDIETIKNMGYEIHTSTKGLPEIKKRYKTLSEEQKKELKDKIRIDDSKSLSIK